MKPEYCVKTTSNKQFVLSKMYNEYTPKQICNSEDPIVGYPYFTTPFKASISEVKHYINPKLIELLIFTDDIQNGILKDEIEKFQK